MALRRELIDVKAVDLRHEHVAVRERRVAVGGRDAVRRIV
jgi:hypothetical protein